MNPKHTYNERVDQFRQLADRLEKKETRLSWYRLVTFVTAILIFFGIYSLSRWVAWSMLTAGLTAFALLIRYHGTTERKRIRARHLEIINAQEVKCLDGDASSFYDGSTYASHAHAYTHDLDIFGPASVFQFVNRTASLPAANTLAEWLKAAAPLAEIDDRQEAVRELQPLIDWRQQLRVLSFENKEARNNPEAVINWLNLPTVFLHRRHIRIICTILSVLTCAVLVLIGTGWPPGTILPVLAVNFFYNFLHVKQVNRLHQQVSLSADMLSSYATTLRHIEHTAFTSAKLHALQKLLLAKEHASSQISRLSKRVNKLDTRLNVMVSVPLNLLFFWDIHQCYALETWKKTHAQKVPDWLDTMAEMEVLSSFANLAYNNPRWTFPVVVPDYFTFNAVDLGHPLIPERTRVPNSFHIDKSGKTILITGSNMSGKSTFLRTCGVNTVLALAGSVVCAASLTLSHVQLYTSMRITDSLEDNTSSFYAELKRLAAIIQHAGSQDNLFLLLDEILRGTNSNDRYIGSVALIRQLLSYRTVALVATHDLKLAEMADTLPQQIENYHLDVQVDGEELYFDYLLKQGVCTSMNASLLMKKMGIRIGQDSE